MTELGEMFLQDSMVREFKHLITPPKNEGGALQKETKCKCGKGGGESPRPLKIQTKISQVGK